MGDRPDFPTMEQVEKADHEQLARWYRFRHQGARAQKRRAGEPVADEAIHLWSTAKFLSAGAGDSHYATYWRQRNGLVQSVGRHIQRMQKALTQMNIQLASVLSDLSETRAIRRSGPLNFSIEIWGQ